MMQFELQRKIWGVSLILFLNSWFSCTLRTLCTLSVGGRKFELNFFKNFKNFQTFWALNVLPWDILCLIWLFPMSLWLIIWLRWNLIFVKAWLVGSMSWILELALFWLWFFHLYALCLDHGFVCIFREGLYDIGLRLSLKLWAYLRICLIFSRDEILDYA